MDIRSLFNRFGLMGVVCNKDAWTNTVVLSSHLIQQLEFQETDGITTLVYLLNFSRGQLEPKSTAVW